MVSFLIELSSPTPAGGLILLPESKLGAVENVKFELDTDNMDCVSVVLTLDRACAQSLVDTVSMILKSSASAFFIFKRFG